MKKTSILLSLALLVVSMSSCAALFRGSQDRVSFQSEPSGAKVYINGQLAGTAPFETMLEAKRSHAVEFRLDGYQTRSTAITSSVGAGWIVLDILGGIIPIIVDAATGSWNGLDQHHVAVVLDKH